MFVVAPSGLDCRRYYVSISGYIPICRHGGESEMTALQKKSGNLASERKASNIRRCDRVLPTCKVGSAPQYHVSFFVRDALRVRPTPKRFSTSRKHSSQLPAGKVDSPTNSQSNRSIHPYPQPGTRHIMRPHSRHLELRLRRFIACPTIDIISEAEQRRTLDLRLLAARSFLRWRPRWRWRGTLG